MQVLVRGGVDVHAFVLMCPLALGAGVINSDFMERAQFRGATAEKDTKQMQVGGCAPSTRLVFSSTK